MSRVAVLVGTKGRGTNMASLLTACLTGDVPAEPALVVAPRAETAAVRRAEALRVPIAIVEPDEDYGQRLLVILQQNRIDWICLAGYMLLLPNQVVDAFPNQILNIHPALLPKYGGKGMYGRHVHEAVLASGDSESGCTVHFVTSVYDEGEIILQRRCPVLPGDDVASLSERVLDLEHLVYPQALKLVITRNA